MNELIVVLILILLILMQAKNKPLPSFGQLKRFNLKS